MLYSWEGWWVFWSWAGGVWGLGDKINNKEMNNG